MPLVNCAKEGFLFNGPQNSHEPITKRENKRDLDPRLIRLFQRKRHLAEAYLLVSLTPRGALTQTSSEETACEGAPGDAPDSHVFQKRHNFTLFLAIDGIVEVLHADEWSEFIGNGVVLHFVDCEEGK